MDTTVREGPAVRARSSAKLGSAARTELIQTYCIQCLGRCGVVCTVEDGVLQKVTPDDAHPNGCVCIKAAAAPEVVYSPDRLRTPMRRTRPKGDPDPGWEPISWEEALRISAAKLLEIREESGPESVVFGRPAPYGSAAFDYVEWLNRLANAFGSPNSMATTHVCNWGRDVGSSYTYGVGIPTPDLDNARCILLWGYNPHVTCVSEGMRVSRAQKRGAKLIVIDPRRVGAADKADLWLRVRPGSDGALALAMIHVLIRERLFDDEFVRRWTNGPFLVRPDTGKLLTQADLVADGDAGCYLAWDERSGSALEYRPDEGYARSDGKLALFGSYSVRLADGNLLSCRPAMDLLAEEAAKLAPERSEAITWVAAADVYRAARLFASEQPSCYSSLVGLEEHSNAMQTNRAVCLFFALTGQFDLPGSNVLFATPPVNPQGGREFLPPERRARRLGLAERPLGAPGNPGNNTAYDMYRAIASHEPYAVRGLVMFGGNILLSNADSLTGRSAMEKLDFYLHVDMFMNPSAALADIVLPACSAWEAEAIRPTFGGPDASCSWAQLRKAVVPPQHQSRSDIRIMFDLAIALGLGDRFWQGDLEVAWNHKVAPSGITVQQLREHPGGMRVPVTTRHRKYATVDSASGRPQGFQTPSRLMEVYSLAFDRHGYPPIPEYVEGAMSPYSRPDLAADYPLVLTMTKLLYFTHTNFRNIPSLRKQVPDPFVEIHPDTAAGLGVTAGEWVVVESPRGRIRLKAKINQWLHPQVVCTQHGWWQGCSELGLPGYDAFAPEGANANLLIGNDELDPISGSVPHRSYLCRIRRAEGAAGHA